MFFSEHSVLVHIYAYFSCPPEYALYTHLILSKYICTNYALHNKGTCTYEMKTSMTAKR